MSGENDFERELRAREEYEEWSKLPLWEQMRSDIADASAYADKVAALGAKLEAMERLKTYAMLLESHVGYGYVNEIRHQLGVTDEMINWIIPADHRKLLDAAQEEK